MNRRRLIITIAITGSVASAPASAQLFGGKTVLKNATVLSPGASRTGTQNIVISGERIEAVAPDASGGFLAKSLDLSGKTVTPGLIDVWSGLGHLGAGSRNDSSARAWDAFDRYARDDFREALSHGVSTIYLAPGARGGINGIGAVIQLVPEKDGSAGRLLREEAALCISMGSDLSATRRAKLMADLHKKFRSAVEYRQSLEDYEEELEEYLEKLEERKKEEDKDEGDKPAPEDRKEEAEKDDSKKDDGSKDKPSGALAFAGEKNNNKKSEKGGNDKKDEDEKEEELKKPTRPKRNPESEIILRAIQREIPVRILAHRSADIENAIQLAEQYDLDWILEGGTEAHLLAETLEEKEVPVILGHVTRSPLYWPGPFDRHTARNAATLERAGVRWAIGSGRRASATRFIALNARLAGAHGVRRNWLDTLTTEAARMLNLRRLGRIAPGRQADLVVWNTSPDDPDAYVERVYVAGKLAYLRDNPEQGK